MQRDEFCVFESERNTHTHTTNTHTESRYTIIIQIHICTCFLLLFGLGSFFLFSSLLFDSLSLASTYSFSVRLCFILQKHLPWQIKLQQ